MSEQYHRIGADGGIRFGKRGAGILFTDGKKVLLLKRSAPGDYPNTWGMPGGKAEGGETYIDAAIREAKEECGKVEGHRIAQFEEKDGLHRWMTYVYAVDKPFECELSDEHKMWKWYDISRLDNVNLHPKFKENMGDYIDLIRKKLNILKPFKEWIAHRDKS